VVFAASGWSQSFTLSANPTAVTIHPGDQNVPVIISVGSSTYTGPISVTLSGLPSGISAAPLTLAAGTSGTLLLSASLSADQEQFPPSDIIGNPVATTSVNVVAVAGLAEITSPLSLTVSLINPGFSPAPGAINLPIMNINTNGVAIVDKTTDVPGTITITSANGQTSYLPNSSDSDNTATFHLHGNTTLLMPKKPYHIKLNTSLDLLTVMGVSCPYLSSKGKAVCDKSKSYDLLANYDDKTFLRDWSASALANAIPIGGDYLNSPADSPTPSGSSTLMPWAPHSLFVELYLNGAYQGNYQLIEEVKVDGNRVNINELAETDTTDDITGGYLVEIDQRQSEDYNWITPQGVYLGLIDPDYTPEVPEQTSYISNYMDTAENALFASNFTDPTLGWRAYFDEASAVNFYIVNDLMGNVDGGAFYSSDYLYKSQDNPLIYMGPIWDFDISSGNVNYKGIENPLAADVQTSAPWYVQWFKDPGFARDVSTQWNTLKNNGVISNWLASIGTEAATLQQSQANNYSRWPVLGEEVFPNPVAAGTYTGEVTYLVDWLTVRVGYLDSLFNTKLHTYTTLVVPSTGLRQGSPATLQATVHSGNGPTGNVAFVANNLLLGMVPLPPSGIASFTTSNLPPGSDSLHAIYVGDNVNNLSESAPVSASVAGPFLTTATTLSSSATTATPQSLPTLTTVVVGNSGTTVPTGSVSYTSNGQPLGTVPLSSNGSASFTPSTLPSGSDTIQAVYSGDGTFGGSSSNQVVLSVAAPPQITSLSANYGEDYATITLTGTNFGATQGPSTVTIGGVLCPATAWSDSSISASVSFHATTGNLVVTVNGQSSNGIPFTVEPPASITAMNPSSGPVGTVVTITGQNLLDAEGLGSIWLGNVALPILNQSTTSIQVRIPAGASSGAIDLHFNGHAHYTPVFTVTPPPNITSLSANYGEDYAIITLTGTNFGASQGSSTVTINGVVCPTSAWADNSINASVSFHATTGNLVVTVSGQSSNGIPFTVEPSGSITAMNPSSGPVGTVVTITGQNLLDAEGLGSIWLGNVALPIVNQSNTSIQVEIPAGASSGAIDLHINGHAHYTPVFTVN
jgi:3D (Asp-Asp-Asp) domain-containing protein